MHNKGKFNSFLKKSAFVLGCVLLQSILGCAHAPNTLDTLPFTADISAGFPDYQYSEESHCQNWLSDHCDNVCMNAQTETLNEVPATCESITSMSCQYNSDGTWHQICTGTYTPYSPPPPPSYPDCPSDKGMFWETNSPGDCTEKCGFLCTGECGEGGGWCSGPPEACYMSGKLGCFCGTLHCVE